MSPANLLQLIVLAALWGASFLFIRVGRRRVRRRAADGPARGHRRRIPRGGAARAPRRTRLCARWLPLLVVGVLNSAAPFCLFAYAELTLSAGATSVINATPPLWGALVAYLWLKDHLTTARTIGMAIGFAGVLVLVWNQIAPASSDAPCPCRACSRRRLCWRRRRLYGVAGNFAKRYLMDVDAMTNATGSMLGAPLTLAPLAFLTWPAAPVSAHAWGAVLALGVGCTGIAYFIYFHLVAVAGRRAR